MHKYLHLVDQRECDQRLFAPLADGLFAASAVGKQWVSDTNLDDQIAAAKACGYHACFVQGSCPDLTVNPALKVESRLAAESPEERRFVQEIRTPEATLERELVERPQEGITPISQWVKGPEHLDAIDWISRRILDGADDARITQTYTQVVRKLSPHGVTQVQLELPYFLYGTPGFADIPLMMHMTETERFARSMALAEKALHRIADLLVAAGIDFIWIGAPGTELMSPAIWEDVIVPQSRRMVEHVHARGGRVHFHCCGQSRLWVEKGYFNQIGMDVLETLSPPPAGTIENLAAARRQTDESIVTRGNIDLGLLRNGTPDECRKAALAVLEAVRGYPHILGAADALLYGTPLENVRAVAEICNEC
jgi:hypothetical protein